MNRQIELVALWLLIITGFLAHTLADVMPAFWGESIVAMPGANNSCELISMMMGGSYTLPVLGVFLALWGRHKAWRVIHAILACLFGLFCLLHMLEWLDDFNPIQLTIMPLMGIIGIILAVKSIKYVCKKRCAENEEEENEAEENEEEADEGEECAEKNEEKELEA